MPYIRFPEQRGYPSFQDLDMLTSHIPHDINNATTVVAGFLSFALEYGESIDVQHPLNYLKLSFSSPHSFTPRVAFVRYLSLSIFNKCRRWPSFSRYSQVNFVGRKSTEARHDYESLFNLNFRVSCASMGVSALANTLNLTAPGVS